MIHQHIHYDSFSALLAFAEKHEKEAVRACNTPMLNSLMRDVDDRLSWGGVTPAMRDAGVRDYASLRAFALGGWAEGAERIASAMSKLADIAPRSVRRRPMWGDQGHEVCMDRVRAGNLDTAWRRMTPRIASGAPHVQIVCQINANADVRPEELFWRGAACALLADRLTQAGYPVSVTAAGLGLSNSRMVLSTTLIQPYGRESSLSDLAASLASAVNYRCIELPARMAAYDFDANWDSPAAKNITPDMIPATARNELPLLLSRSHGVCDLTSANTWVIGAVAKIEQTDLLAAA